MRVQSGDARQRRAAIDSVDVAAGRRRAREIAKQRGAASQRAGAHEQRGAPGEIQAVPRVASAGGIGWTCLRSLPRQVNAAVGRAEIDRRAAAVQLTLETPARLLADGLDLQVVHAEAAVDARAPTRRPSRPSAVRRSTPPLTVSARRPPCADAAERQPHAAVRRRHLDSVPDSLLRLDAAVGRRGLDVVRQADQLDAAVRRSARPR